MQILILSFLALSGRESSLVIQGYTILRSSEFFSPLFSKLSELARQSYAESKYARSVT